MAAWEPMPEGVTWRSPPLFNFRLSRVVMLGRLGPPHAVDEDSNGVGLFDAWGLRFPCGLEVRLWMFHSRSDFSVIEDPDEAANIEVHANSPQEKHILFHLPLPVTEVSYWIPSRLVPEPLAWSVLRQDDNGNRFEIARYPSRCEALSVAASFEALGHKQMYWVEGKAAS